MFSVCWSIKSAGGVSRPVNSNSMSPDTVRLVVKPNRQDGWDHTCPTDVQVLLIGSWWVNTTVQMTPAVSVRVASLSDDRWLKQSSLCCHHLTSDSVSLLQFLFISRSHWCYCNRRDVCLSFDFQCMLFRVFTICPFLLVVALWRTFGSVPCRLDSSPTGMAIEK